jgi:hypothetical protein
MSGGSRRASCWRASLSSAISDGFDFAAQPSIDKKQIREIAVGRFIANAEEVLLLGSPGVGKPQGKGRSRGARSIGSRDTGLELQLD